MTQIMDVPCDLIVADESGTVFRIDCHGGLVWRLDLGYKLEYLTANAETCAVFWTEVRFATAIDIRDGSILLKAYLQHPPSTARMSRSDQTLFAAYQNGFILSLFYPLIRRPARGLASVCWR
jgi:hypothetical protein